MALGSIAGRYSEALYQAVWMQFASEVPDRLCYFC